MGISGIFQSSDYFGEEKKRGERRREEKGNVMAVSRVI